jgi:hypothetical protein
MTTHRYNQVVKKLPSLALCSLAFLLLSSCAKDIQNTEAVRQGVLDYLKQRSTEIGIDMNAMDVKVTSVSFEKDVARANVSFIPKGMPDGAGMNMAYVFDRKGDKWAVRKSESGMASPHAGQAPGETAAPSGAAPAGQMPPGHPPMGSAPTGQLPPGHPPTAGATGTK